MFYVENKRLGFNEPVYFIADIAANHDGDIERAKDLIFLASAATFFSLRSLTRLKTASIN